MSYVIKPIGVVKKTGEMNFLEINQEYWEATTHLDLFSHAIVLWWIDGLDTSDTRHTILANPPKNKGPVPSGVFACRSPARPNPIGHTIVKIISVDENNRRILIDHMDANDGSPLIDIKPYLPSSDRVDNAKVAPWFENLDNRYTK
ncbi:tRNA (N6-threonylcarbamoyladenosine(37)-N6)-methyltransferase TrmO [Candidatus Thorarchaeota archaeon]|nr:MAG: tRNA (N6-threonylcarbamoyladenosine(37)-N6)-methyltransferase TrmO [Candidatus Thorarchaeota archaeon]